MMKTRKLISLLAGLLLLAGTSLAAERGDRPAPAGKQEYVVGVTPQFEASKLFGIWRPLLDALEKETGLDFTLRGAPAINDFEQQYGAGMFDFAYANPFFVGVRNYQGYLPLVRDHGARLAGVVVVAKDSPINSVRELDGQTVAFPAANSLAGSLAIRAQLEDEFGVRVVPKFVRTHDSSFLNVAVGTVVAGGGVRSTLEQQSPEIRDRLRVLYTTRELPPLPIVAHPRVPEAVRQRVKAALLKLGASPEGKELLAKVPIKQVGAAAPADYEALRRMRLERYEN
ncbi:MAG: phosphate/phosphite/phosphonate ABC transporter substrate-binding protein [Gammaproteobacteria bacterium]|nr:phosphate/phosphite/phosphonate ABC transporter substrate-binding protein [Gammaproteobacteria bacterium]MBU3990020.1 phosphate/phosphite/phosphonate ABC transporter substrate-binding protein [Gammaproteobacteria bacterium]MBU4005672.1 phosphate/phosphite/phosphonate ABC transporter substrate-binding protein [Gammaproteobacteria bacterium]MBU4020775.1 phosphate/phosphite/phosphonate ABC transporter substrate-binding protein [Gammaproteobacteria bacterium]MBU4096594.1 phosphate/phosphite/phos